MDADLLQSMVDGFLQDLTFEFDLSNEDEAINVLKKALESRKEKQ